MSRRAPTLGDTLEATRLAHRRSRLEMVLAALRERVADAEHSGDPAPAPLRAAIAGFDTELAQVRRSLRRLAGATLPPPSPRRPAGEGGTVAPDERDGDAGRA
jgi:hypothetical protein